MKLTVYDKHALIVAPLECGQYPKQIEIRLGAISIIR